MSSDRRANAGFLELAFDAFVSESFGGNRDDLVPYAAAVIGKKLTENAAWLGVEWRSGKRPIPGAVTGSHRFQEALVAQDSIRDD
jgi:hypothetical protein